MGKRWKWWEIIFFGSKITVDGDCSHKIQRHLLLGRKAVTNLDSILKSRDITFANKGPSSGSYGCSGGHVWMWELDYKESWAPKNWCFWTVVLGKTLESYLDCKEIHPVHPKGDQSWVFIGRTDAEVETPILWPPDATRVIWKDPDAGKDWGQGQKGMTEDEMAGWHHRHNRHGFRWTLGVGNGQGGLVCCNWSGRKESDTTELLNWTKQSARYWESSSREYLSLVALRVWTLRSGGHWVRSFQSFLCGCHIFLSHLSAQVFPVANKLMSRR